MFHAAGKGDEVVHDGLVDVPVKKAWIVDVTTDHQQLGQLIMK